MSLTEAGASFTSSTSSICSLMVSLAVSGRAPESLDLRAQWLSSPWSPPVSLVSSSETTSPAPIPLTCVRSKSRDDPVECGPAWQPFRESSVYEAPVLPLLPLLPSAASPSASLSSSTISESCCFSTKTWQRYSISSICCSFGLLGDSFSSL